MGKGANLLTDIQIKNAHQRGRLRDGQGLWLNVSATGNKAWVYRWTRGSKAREMGLGSYPATSLAMARQKATECRALVSEGLNPKQERDKSIKEAEKPNFKKCVELFLAEKEGEWSNAKHKAQWRMTLGSSYCSKIENLQVSEITVHDVLGVLREPWQSRPETASRLRGRIERVLAFAAVMGWRSGDNPARWQGNLKDALPKRDEAKRGHYAAMPYNELPAFMETLKARPADSARALELLIFTLARTKNIVEMRWADIDFEKAIWTIPAPVTKTKKEYVIPLSKPALAILEAQQEIRRSQFVFTGRRKGAGIHADKPMSNMSLLMLLRRMHANNATPHGFRSSFRDWAGDETSFDREAIEFCLAHSVGNATEQAYRRSTAIEKRRVIMESWADYCTGSGSEKIVLFPSA